MDPEHTKGGGEKKRTEHVGRRKPQERKKFPAGDAHDEKKGDSRHDFAVHVNCPFLKTTSNCCPGDFPSLHGNRNITGVYPGFSGGGFKMKEGPI
jgi:hypothetical protein